MGSKPKLVLTIYIYIYIYIYIKKERDEGNKVDVYAREKDEREVSGSSCGGLDIT